MTDKDRSGVKAVLAVFSFLPAFLVRAFYWLTDQHGSGSPATRAFARS